MEIIKRILSLDRENRRKLAREIQSNPKVWNAINGLDDVPENMASGILTGLVVNGDEIIIDAKVYLTPSSRLIKTIPGEGKNATPVIIVPENPTASTNTSIRGEYKMEVPPGSYNIFFFKDGLTTVVNQNIEIVSELTTLFNGRFGS